MGKRFFRLGSPVVRLFLPRLTWRWDVPFDREPCIFVCNHERAMGPLQMAINFPLREQSRIWIYDGPLHRETFRAYVLQDHWWKEDGFLAPVLNVILPPVLGAIVPPVLRSVPHVPVYHEARAMRTIRESLRILRDEGQHMVIFPEIPTAFGAHETEKINEGFLCLMPMYEHATGRPLRIWPMHMDLEKKEMHVKAPISFDMAQSLPDQVPRLTREVLDGIFT